MGYVRSPLHTIREQPQKMDKSMKLLQNTNNV